MTTTTEVPAQARPRAQPLKLILTVSLCCVVIGLLVWQRDRLAALPRVLMHAKWGWILLAIVAQVASIGALAREQRRLISVRGGRRPLPSVLATTWAGNAISISLPIVGSATATVFVYRRFTSIGVDRALAAWALAISGIYSTVSFAVIAAIGAMISGSPALAITGAITVLVGVIPISLVLLGLRRPRVHAGATTALAAILRLTQRLFKRPTGNADQISSSTLDQLISLRLNRSSGLVAGSMAFVNWILDLACLTCAILAVHGTVPWHGLILAWAAGSGVSTLGLTPGGLGVVEITLGAALIAAGMPADLAIAAALLYRVIKLGLILAVGGATLLILRITASAPALPPDNGTTAHPDADQPAVTAPSMP